MVPHICLVTNILQNIFHVGTNMMTEFMALRLNLDFVFCLSVCYRTESVEKINPVAPANPAVPPPTLPKPAGK